MSQSNSAVSPFPFELMLTDIQNDPEKQTELFLVTVEQVLQEDLQAPESFGCKIADCHTHVGSKRHLGFFIEAELLFHNSYYNKGFAYLTAQKIIDHCRAHDDVKRVLLVGCETFCELFLCETCSLLATFNADYCIYETVGPKQGRIRRLSEWVTEDPSLCGTLLVFIVPISTTLTTHDKLIASFFRNYINLNKASILSRKDLEEAKRRALNFGLIVIGDSSAENPYWIKDAKEHVLHPNTSSELFQELNDEKEIHYFAFAESKWYQVENCPMCFPDVCGNGTITDEVPLFGVNRASVVPMLQLNVNRIPAPRLVSSANPDVEINFQRVVHLSDFMYHHHLLRNSDHYQYYFDTDSFFKENRADITDWLKSVVRKDLIPLNSSCEMAVYHIIVAPRHYSNANLVQLVNDAVFDGTARIFYFDVQREFRGNINAKYSDFSRFINNLNACRYKYEIHFHFVDDSIYMGSNFARTKSLIQTLTDRNASGPIKLYYSVILLLGRSSNETKRSLLDDISHFYEYVHLSISPMRHHEDACTLCQLTNNFATMSESCASNSIHAFCIEKIRDHQLISVDSFMQSVKTPYAGFEKQMRMFLSHILATCLSNQWALDLKKPVINRENDKDVERLLDEVYLDLGKPHGKLSRIIKNAHGRMSTELNGTQARIAMIKVISRPFFTYSIRQKQAAFRFCLKKLKDCFDNPSEDCGIIIALLNALADMESNYLLRAVAFNSIYKLYPDDKEKAVTLRNAFFKAVEKMIAFSMDATKSVFLESILVTGNESSFFDNTQSYNNSTLLASLSLTEWFALYLENNRLLREGFADISREKNYDALQTTPYYLANFKKIFTFNLPDLNNRTELLESYCYLQSFLCGQENDQATSGQSLNDAGHFKDLAERIHKLFACCGAPVDGDILPFVEYKDQKIISSISYRRKYILLYGDNEMQNNFESAHFLTDLEKTLKNNPILDTLYYAKNRPYCIVKISSWGIPLENKYPSGSYRDCSTAMKQPANCMYFYIPLEKGETLEKLWNEDGGSLIDKRGSRFLLFAFALKLLLSLRNEFTKMIALNFANDSIQRLVLESERSEALSISKANRHGSIRYYSSLDYHQVKDKLDDNDDEYKNLLDNYIQLLANDFIASLYRDASSGAFNKLTIDDSAFEVLRSGASDQKRQMYRLLLQAAPNQPGCFRYEMMGPCKRDKNTPVQLTLVIEIHGLEEGGRWKLMCLERDDCSVSPTLLLIFLLATNARFHTPSSVECCKVLVYREGTYLCVKNEIDKAEEIVKEVNETLEHQPHRLQKQSITLWALKQYCEKLNELNSTSTLTLFDDDAPSFEIQAENGKYFCVKLKLFDKEV